MVIYFVTSHRISHKTDYFLCIQHKLIFHVLYLMNLRTQANFFYYSFLKEENFDNKSSLVSDFLRKMPLGMNAS